MSDQVRDPDGQRVLRVKGRVLVGPDQVRDELWAVDGRITYERPPGADRAQTVTGWALPGLVDAHGHVGLDRHGPVDAATAEKQALTDREAGTLPIRTRDRPPTPGGSTSARTCRRSSGRAATSPGPAATSVTTPTRSSPATSSRTSPRRPGAATAGSSWGPDRPDAGDLTACWPRGEVEAAIASVLLVARVTAHCFAEEALRDLVEAGIDCIEHATGLTEETIPLFAERGVAIVPTLVNIATFPDLAAGGEAKFPRWSAHMRQLYERRYDTVRAAYDAGIPVYVGTDAGGSLAHGLVAGEVAELVKAGIPPLEALSATAWGARRWLGRPVLEEGVRGPGRVRRGSARGRPGAGGSAPHRAERG
ncbi:Amidohydrolase family protein OS=Streptomyces microflavus OX=1919 GN=G3I39_04435 PE=4 SV=1 [Streptomyces microflavus]